MATRKRPARPVEIVLTEEDLASIIRETVRALPKSPVPTDPDPRPVDEGFAGVPYAPVGDRAWNLGVRSAGAVGDAIRMILDATTLDRGKRMRGLDGPIDVEG